MDNLKLISNVFQAYDKTVLHAYYYMFLTSSIDLHNTFLSTRVANCPYKILVTGPDVISATCSPDANSLPSIGQVQ